MKHSVSITRKIAPYFHKVGGMIKDENAQGGMVGFFIGAMIALIVALQVTLPVLDDILNGGSAAITNLSTSATTLLNLVPLFLILTVVMIFIRPLL